MREDTLHGVLERHAKLRGDRLAIITETSRWTYGALNEKANQLGGYLRERGVQPGERVAVLCRNDEWFALAFFALLKIGAVVVPTNVRLMAHELEQLFTRHHVTGVIYHESLADGLPNCDLRHSYGVYDACEKALSYPGTDLSVARSPKEPCELLFTSGTTGRPKGALFNHERILNTARAIAAEFRVTEKDVWLHLMPLTHAAPLNTFFMSGLVAGTGHVIGDFSPDAFLRWIERERTTLTFAAPVAYLLAARQLADAAYRLDSMRLYAYGGGPLPAASYEQVRDAFQSQAFYQVYGLTESGPNGIFLRPEEHATKAGSIGKTPVRNMKLRVVTADGADAATGEYGEILLAGNSLMLGYDNDPAETNHVLRDGWLYTGDIAYRDEDGYVYIVDRKKDVIITGGVNVYPREVEEALARHPAVMESCVVGVPHPVWGETVKACVVLRTQVTEAELRQHVRAYLADFKCPRIYEFLSELPRNANGKVLKQRLKAL